METQKNVFPPPHNASPGQSQLKFESGEFDKYIPEATSQFGYLTNDGVEITKLNFIGVGWIFSQMCGLVYLPEEDTVWDKNDQGCWRKIPEDIICARISEFLTRYFNQKGRHIGFKAKSNMAKEILKQVKNFSRQPGFFKNSQGEFIIHCRNCFLVYDHQKVDWVQKPLDTQEIHSRNQLNVAYDPDAKAPRFMELLENTLDKDDIRVFMEYAGQVCFGQNITQTILIISGAAGSGKSTAVNTIEMVVGEDNATELRTGALHGYYEIGRYKDKTLLIGRDVPADFLQVKGAEYLKKLTGGDNVVVERKHSNFVGSYRGNLNVIIISNTHQPIRIEGDRDAWERRVRTIQFHAPVPPVEPIRDLDAILAHEEGSGILNLALDGLTRIIQSGGKLEAGERQLQQIKDLLDESESVKVFIRERVELEESGKDNVTTMELYEAYSDYCDGRGWDPLPFTKASKQFPDAMASAFKVEASTDIMRNGSNKRGYRRVRIKSDKQNV